MRFDPDPVLLALALVAVVAVVWWHRGAARSPSTWARLTVVLLLAGACLQPRVGGEEPPPPPSRADVVVIVDRTTSMAAQDYDGGRPRMTGVAADVEELVAMMPEARYTVVTADNEARIAAPWTTDTRAVVTLARTMGWREEGFGTGSDISAGVPRAESLLGDSARLRPAAARYLVYLGDGEQISEAEPRSFSGLAGLIDDALVLGYGTAEGGVMAMRVDTDELVTRDGVAQRSMIDESRLRGIAEELGGTYLHRAAPGPLTGWVPSHAGLGTGAGGDPGFGVGWLLALAAAAVLGVDVAVVARRARLAWEEVR